MRAVNAAEVRHVLSDYDILLDGIADARQTAVDEICAINKEYREKCMLASVYMSAYAIPETPPCNTNETSDPTCKKSVREVRYQEEYMEQLEAGTERLISLSDREHRLRRIHNVYDRLIDMYPRHYEAARLMYVCKYKRDEVRHQMACSNYVLRDMLSRFTHLIAGICNTVYPTDYFSLLSDAGLGRLIRHNICEKDYNILAKREKESEIMIVGIDHGFGYIKTRHSEFPAGVAKFDYEPPLKSGLVEYEGKFYQTGVQPDGLASDKTATEDYLILTLAGIAEELRAKGQTGGYITLAVGVPLTRYGREKNALESYLTEKKQITYKYEGVEYRILDIPHIYTYPQGYSAIAGKLAEIRGACYLVDIGTGTTDVSPVTSGKTIDMSKARTIQMGISNCISMVNEALSREYQTELSTDVIIDIMTGGDAVLAQPVRELCEATISEWCDVVLKTLHANKVNYEYTQTFFCGGGAGLLKRFAKNLDIESGCMTFITDIRANAKGYELLAAAQTKRAENMRKGS